MREWGRQGIYASLWWPMDLVLMAGQGEVNQYIEILWQIEQRNVRISHRMVIRFDNCFILISSAYTQ